MLLILREECEGIVHPTEAKMFEMLHQLIKKLKRLEGNKHNPPMLSQSCAKLEA